MAAVRRKCVDCCGGSFKAVRWCPATDCPLWSLRFGCRPATARKRYGAEVTDPDRMPDHLVPLESLR